MVQVEFSDRLGMGHTCGCKYTDTWLGLDQWIGCWYVPQSPILAWQVSPRGGPHRSRAGKCNPSPRRSRRGPAHSVWPERRSRAAAAHSALPPAPPPTASPPAHLPTSFTRDSPQAWGRSPCNLDLSKNYIHTHGQIAQIASI